MEILYTNCAGLDVHKKTVVACVLRQASSGSLQKEWRTYFTTVEELWKLSDWLTEQGCTHVAFEATGVYWKPVFNLLEGNFEVLVVNAQPIKAVPGRKTDVKDAEWIADLLQHGLLKASFIPSGPQRQLRDLTRYRLRLTQEKAREVKRVQKTLEDTNLKLGDVVSDIMGKASRLILQALADGETDPARLAALAVGRVRADQEQLEAALQGHVTDHHRFLLSEHLTQIRHLEEAIERVTAEITRRLTPAEETAPSGKEEEVMAERVPDSAAPQESASAARPPLSWLQAVVLLCSIPGIGVSTAMGIVAEIGLNMQQFPSAGHLASWAGLCPGNRESAGKRGSGKTRKGNPCLRCLLVQAAHSASHQKNCYLAEQYRRIAKRRGSKRAAVAVAHSILVIIYHLLRNQATYQEKGETFFEEQERQGAQKRLVRQLTRLGYHVDLQPMAQVG
jgi:transposase